MSSFRLPGARDVRATLDRSATEDSSRVVVACPPHPQLAGDRRDGRLRALSDALAERNVDCLRFDYGRWDDGIGEQTDARMAIEWAQDDYRSVGLFGYSFGASIALLVAAGDQPGPDAVSALAPGDGLIEEDDVSRALASISAPTQIIYGERDDVVAWEPVVELARVAGVSLEAVAGDHFFVGQQQKVANLAADFLSDNLRE